MGRDSPTKPPSRGRRIAYPKLGSFRGERYTEFPLGFGWRAHAGGKREAHDVREAVLLHLFHYMGPVDFHRARRDIELIGDDLVRLPRDKALEHLALTFGQKRD